MKFRNWLNENVWVDAAKSYLKLPSAMSDQDVMQHIGKMSQPEQMQMVSSVPFYAQKRINTDQGMPLTLFKNYKQIADTIEQIDNEVEEQLGQVEVIKKYAKEVGYGSDRPVKFRLENATNIETSKTVIRNPIQEPALTTQFNANPPAVSSQPPMQSLYMLEKELTNAMTDVRKNHFEIRRMWDELGWTGKKKADTFAKTGMRGLGESTELGGDSEKYFPNGQAELEHRIKQTVHQVQTMNRHIDGALRTLGMRRQYIERD